MRSRNEQIELDNFKADYFDANTTGKIPLFRLYLAVTITAAKTCASIVASQILFYFSCACALSLIWNPLMRAKFTSRMRCWGNALWNFCYQYSHRLRTFFLTFYSATILTRYETLFQTHFHAATYPLLRSVMSRGSAVGITTGYGLGDREVFQGAQLNIQQSGRNRNSLYS
jgi:hypothetical protein